MSKNRNRNKRKFNNHQPQKSVVEVVDNTDSTSIDTFSFGEAVSVLDASSITSLFESWYNGIYYELPYNVHSLCKFFNAGLHLKSAIMVKRNILASAFKGHKLLSRQSFSKFALDYLWFGNAYIEKVDSKVNQPMKLIPSPAKYTRRLRNDDRYIFLNHGANTSEENHHEFKRGAIFHLMEPDINQEIYGVPEWMAAVNAALLNEAATNFRLRYYRNGSHAGYILYMTDAANNEEDIKNLKEALKSSKGPGNFKNLMIYAPNGKKDGLQIMPISEVTAKDEFFNIKSVTRDDQLAAARVPPNIMGIVPTNTSGFGSIEDAAKVFNRNEIVPLQQTFLQLNEWLGDEVIAFDDYVIETSIK